jgi:hypothetical protein
MENNRVHKKTGAKTAMSYWPGTKIPKSRGNAFDWHGQESLVMRNTELTNINNSRKATTRSYDSKPFTIYSKAVRSK